MVDSKLQHHQGRGEFDLIRDYFTFSAAPESGVELGVGDDAAIVTPAPGSKLVLTLDTLVAGVHFFSDTDPARLGHKSLAVNLSDLAAMGARPRWALLALTLPVFDADWLAAFSGGLKRLADRYAVALIGGDTTRGPLSISIQALGELPRHHAGLRRNAAEVGDAIYVTGSLGLAGLGLRILQGTADVKEVAAINQLEQPEPQVRFGMALLDIAHACIDVSDGLAGDLGHILAASQVGACLDWERLPLNPCVADYCDSSGDWQMPLTAGDDYQLCFTVPVDAIPKIELLSAELGVVCTRVGRIERAQGLRIQRPEGLVVLPMQGYRHFV